MEMKNYLRRIGYDYHILNQLNVIHVAGTKGKGSTSAFCESILRKHKINKNGDLVPIKTGLFTSPHIMEARERIRINGKPISKELFAKYFFSVWDRLEETTPKIVDIYNPDKPHYFRFLTLVSFHTFLEEKVDTVVLEVGVGGEYDATNVIEQPVVCGITSLGMDHISLLGDTIEKIAWHKAGIIKSHRPAFTVPQPGGAGEVIEARAKDANASKFVCASWEEIDQLKNYKLGLAGDHQKINAKLAMMLSEAWIEAKRAEGLEIVGDEQTIRQGLAETTWPGRCQTHVSAKYPNATWYLDGAHTPESLDVCGEWFTKTIRQTSNRSLIFNCTHGRTGKDLFPALLKRFKNISFDKVVFTTNDPWKDPSAHSGGDLINNMTEPDLVLKAQHDLKDIWLTLAKEYGVESKEVLVVGSCEEAIGKAYSENSEVLITGSLHLVGSCLTAFGANVE
ncbi:Folylpolyglutamate synthetase [Boothiomyces sp. JEL0866]|nr:Folylpolyglutamate synthetase [Boothiomyces sp. JEL0866]